jgi:hypothetical protein
MNLVNTHLTHAYLTKLSYMPHRYHFLKFSQTESEEKTLFFL